MFPALLGGLLGSGVALFFLAGKKVSDLEARAKAIETGRGATSMDALVLSRRAQQLETDLRHEVERQIAASASATADQYMADVYGLTPQRIASISALARRLGV